MINPKQKLEEQVPKLVEHENVLQDKIMSDTTKQITIDVRKGHGNKNYFVPKADRPVTGTIDSPDKGYWHVIVRKKKGKGGVLFDQYGLKQGDSRDIEYSNGVDTISVDVYWEDEHRQSICEDTTFIATIEY